MANDDAFWNENPQEEEGSKESSFPDFLNGADFATYAEEETVLLVSAVREGSTKHGKSFFVDLETPKGKFTKVMAQGGENTANRDKLIRQMDEHLQKGGESIPVICVFWGAAHSFSRPIS